MQSDLQSKWECVWPGGCDLPAPFDGPYCKRHEGQAQGDDLFHLGECAATERIANWLDEPLNFYASDHAVATFRMTIADQIRRGAFTS